MGFIVGIGIIVSAVSLFVLVNCWVGSLFSQDHCLNRFHFWAADILLFDCWEEFIVVSSSLFGAGFIVSRSLLVFHCWGVSIVALVLLLMSGSLFGWCHCWC